VSSKGFFFEDSSMILKGYYIGISDAHRKAIAYLRERASHDVRIVGYPSEKENKKKLQETINHYTNTKG
jgi:hypothetical protein